MADLNTTIQEYVESIVTAKFAMFEISLTESIKELRINVSSMTDTINSSTDLINGINNNYTEFKSTLKLPAATDSNALRRERIGLEKYHASNEANNKLAIVAAKIDIHGNKRLD